CSVDLRPPRYAVEALLCAFCADVRDLHSFPTRRSSDLTTELLKDAKPNGNKEIVLNFLTPHQKWGIHSTYSENLLMLTLSRGGRSEEHTSELQSRENLVCRLLLEKK